MLSVWNVSLNLDFMYIIYLIAVPSKIHIQWLLHILANTYTGYYRANIKVFDHFADITISQNSHFKILVWFLWGLIDLFNIFYLQQAACTDVQKIDSSIWVNSYYHSTRIQLFIGIWYPRIWPRLLFSSVVLSSSLFYIGSICSSSSAFILNFGPSSHFCPVSSFPHNVLIRLISRSFPRNQTSFLRLL